MFLFCLKKKLILGQLRMFGFYIIFKTINVKYPILIIIMQKYKHSIRSCNEILIKKNSLDVLKYYILHYNH